jgi:hypothetical protein
MRREFALQFRRNVNCRLISESRFAGRKVRASLKLYIGSCALELGAKVRALRFQVLISKGQGMPTERDLTQQYKATASAGQAALVRFLGECFTDALLTRDYVASAALAAHFARKLEADGNAAELRALMVQDYLKSWVEGEADKIMRGRKARFTEKRDGSEIFDEARLACRDRETDEVKKKADAWKASEQARHNLWLGRAAGEPGLHT